MTDIPTPEYGPLGLPEDRVTTTATSAHIALTAAGDGRHVIPNLIIDTTNLGVFQILLPRTVMNNLTLAVEQYRQLTFEDMQAVVANLHRGEENPT